MAWAVILDACVLVPAGVRDDLLSVADTGIYRATWSAAILEEVDRTLRDKWDINADARAAMFGEMRRAFPHAVVDGWEAMLPAVPDFIHPGDHHVVAAAMRASSNLIVTANRKHFGKGKLAESHSIEIKHPADFLIDQWTMDPARVSRGVGNQAVTQGWSAEELVERVAARYERYSDVLRADLDVLREGVVAAQAAAEERRKRARQQN